MADGEMRRPDSERAPGLLVPEDGLEVAFSDVELFEPSDHTVASRGSDTPPPRSEGPAKPVIETVYAVDRFDFDRCPICLDPDPTTVEHVPQRGLGGAAKTLTCGRCNSDLGSRLEASLLDWWQNAIVDVRISSETVEGNMRERKLEMTWDDEAGEWKLLFPKGIVGRVDEMLRTGTITMTFKAPNRNAVKLALLKNAYLGACVAVGEIVDGEQADAIRADLLLARDSDLHRAPESNIADRLAVISSGVSLPVPLGVAELRFSDSRPSGWILLGGRLLVSWPFDRHVEEGQVVLRSGTRVHPPERPSEP